MAERRETTPAVWDPWRDLGPYGRWGGAPGLVPLFEAMDEMLAPRLKNAASLSPAIDVDETEQGYNVSIELPGVTREDIDVSLEANVLTIRGEKKQEEQRKKGRRRWTERMYGAFQRSFTLPADSDPGRLEASFRDGVLRIDVPKTEASKPKKIAVTTP